MFCSRLKIHVFARLCSFTFVFDDLHAETYHPEGCFRKNKANSPIVQTDLTSFTTMNYTIFASLTKVKNKPNQTQFKANSNPIAERLKMSINIYHTKEYNNKTAFRREKNKPKQSQNKPNWSEAQVLNFSKEAQPALSVVEWVEWANFQLFLFIHIYFV